MDQAIPGEAMKERGGIFPEKLEQLPPLSMGSVILKPPPLLFMQVPSSSTTSPAAAASPPPLRLPSTNQQKITAVSKIPATSKKMMILLPRSSNARALILTTALKPSNSQSIIHESNNGSLAPVASNLAMRGNCGPSDCKDKDSAPGIVKISSRKRKKPIATTEENSAHGNNTALLERIEALEKRVDETVRRYEARIMKLELTVAQITTDLAEDNAANSQ